MARLLIRPRGSRLGSLSVEAPWEGPSVRPVVEDITKKIMSSLPERTELIAPWQFNSSGLLEFGVRAVADARDLSHTRNTVPIPFSEQLFETLRPDAEGTQYLEDLSKAAAYPAVTVFPRRRDHRRSDKNWSEDHYRELISLLLGQVPDLRVYIAGAPGGCHFADKPVPSGCIDLIRVPTRIRLSVHLAAVQSSHVAVGAMSGAMLLAAAAGCPTVIFGYAEQESRYRRENVLGSPMDYVGDMNPDPDDIADRVLMAMETQP